MSEQDNGQVFTLQHPTTNAPEAWQAYWEAQGWPWRTEPEIDIERQKYLAERRAITPDLEKGTYPFREVKLKRADVEWLLATHENGRGPVDWNDKSQRGREGLDLRGVDLRDEDLSRLPLACLNGGLDMMGWVRATEEQREALVIHLEKSYLRGTYLQGSNFCWARLEMAKLDHAHLEMAILRSCHLEKASLYKTNLDDSNLEGTHLEGASLTYTHLRNANLDGVNMERAVLYEADLEGANLRIVNMKNAMVKAHLENADLVMAQLEGAALRDSHLEGANLSQAYLDSATQLNDITLYSSKYHGVSLADIRWGDTNLAVVDWKQLNMLGDEYEARQKRHTKDKGTLIKSGEAKDRVTRLRDYERAARANRQLAVALQSQGLNEDASRFAYRAQLCQRIVLRLQRRFVSYLFSGFLDLLAGYGYSPGRSVIWYVATILVFAFAYHLLGGLPLYPPDAFVFSVMSFHGRGFFPALSQETNLHNPLVMLAAVEAIVGLLIEISFIATFTQRFFGR